MGPASVHKHFSDIGDIEVYRSNWRQEIFIEYYYVSPNNKCMRNCSYVAPQHQYPHQDANCVDLTPEKNSQCWGGNGCNENCYPTESPANNFIAIRGMPDSQFGDILYSEYQSGNQSKNSIEFTKVDFVEMFNASMDTWMLNNLAANPPGQDPATQFPAHHEALHKWFQC